MREKFSAVWSSSCRRIGSNAVSQVNLSFFNFTAIQTEVVGLQDEGRCVALHFEHLIMAYGCRNVAKFDKNYFHSIKIYLHSIKIIFI